MNSCRDMYHDALLHVNKTHSMKSFGISDTELALLREDIHATSGYNKPYAWWNRSLHLHKSARRDSQRQNLVTQTRSLSPHPCTLITYAWTIAGRWLHDTAAFTLHMVTATINELIPCFITPNKLAAHIVKLKGKSGHAEWERVDNNWRRSYWPFVRVGSSGKAGVPCFAFLNNVRIQWDKWAKC